MVEQPLLPPEAAAVAGQLAVAADDPVAGDDDREGSPPFRLLTGPF
jgi:hypothetical protein